MDKDAYAALQTLAVETFNEWSFSGADKTELPTHIMKACRQHNDALVEECAVLRRSVDECQKLLADLTNPPTDQSRVGVQTAWARCIMEVIAAAREAAGGSSIALNVLKERLKALDEG